MKDDVAILMDQFIKKLQEKGYLEDNGMYNLDTLQKETGYDYYYLMCSNNWNTLYILPRNPTEVKYVLYNRLHRVLLEPYDNERWTWFQYSPVSDLWISEERRAKDDEMCTLIKNTAKQLGINLQSSLEQAAELLADNEFEDI